VVTTCCTLYVMAARFSNTLASCVLVSVILLLLIVILLSGTEEDIYASRWTGTRDLISTGVAVRSLRYVV